MVQLARYLGARKSKWTRLGLDGSKEVFICLDVFIHLIVIQARWHHQESHRAKLSIVFLGDVLIEGPTWRIIPGLESS